MKETLGLSMVVVKIEHTRAKERTIDLGIEQLNHEFSATAAAAARSNMLSMM